MKRKVGLFLVFAAALPLAVTSVAWACGVLASLRLNTNTAAPGQAIVATGNNYGANSPVTLRLRSRSGQVLSTTATDAAGRINQNFTVPSNLSPGWYVVLATQFNANGTPRAGTPGRTTFRVAPSAGSRSAETVASPWGASTPSGPGASPAAVDSGSRPVLPLVLAAALSLMMLAGGWTLLARKSRPVSGPQFGI